MNSQHDSDDLAVVQLVNALRGGSRSLNVRQNLPSSAL
jgi:hypothetical protein